MMSESVSKTMKRSKQEEVCSFTVVDDSQELKQIIVTQDSVGYYKRDNSHKKTLHLETVDGPEVFKTADPNVFKLQNGSILKRRSR